MAFKVPILLIAFNRPELVSKVIDSLRLIKPAKIYVACDGPNEKKLNKEKVRLTREIIISNIDWETKLQKKFSNSNKGCKYAVSSSIDWFFDNEEEGIILEDDCLPHNDFFYFCESLLNKYKYDERIWSITGSNFVGKKIGDGSYFFSRYNHCWGWATWKRCWDKYDLEMKLWPKYLQSKLLKTNFPDKKEYIFWKQFFEKFYEGGRPNTWDYQWFFTSLINNGLTVTPNKNLIENIGFGPDATHTKVGQTPAIVENYNKKSGILPIKHPTFINRSIEADEIVEIKNFSGPYFLSLIWFKKHYLRIFKKFSRIFLKQIF